MKTNEEKIQMINDACDYLKAAGELIAKAHEAFRECGVSCCGSYSGKRVEEWDTYGCNQQIFKGIKKLGEIVGVEPHYAETLAGEVDKRLLEMELNGLVFAQFSPRANEYEFE